MGEIMTTHNQLTQHELLIAELDRQKQLREDAPKREKAMELARKPVDISRYRNERNLMLYPFCATAKRKRINGILYKTSNRKHWLEVVANAKYGMAKIWDFDILRFALSKAGEIAREVGYFPEVVEFAGYECLKAIGRYPKSGKNHEWLKEALLRLSTTAYHSNIFTDDDERSVFTLVKVSYRQDSNDGFVKVCMRFDQRLIDSAYQHRGLLAIDKAVLHEEAGIKKRLLELVPLLINSCTRSNRHLGSLHWERRRKRCIRISRQGY